jgi:hypothetical protein
VIGISPCKATQVTTQDPNEPTKSSAWRASSTRLRLPKAIHSATMRAYHLTSATYALSNLRHRRLKIATFNDLNDPFELWAVAQPDQTLRRALRGFKKEIAQQYGVLCFSKTWKNPVLWSHYADRHRGIALGFDINKHIIKDVKYKSTRPRFTKVNEATLHTLLYTKYKDWKYEQEWRIITHLEEHDAKGRYFGDFNNDLVLREVITGALCTTTKAEIQKALRDDNVTITKARLAFNTFNVVTQQQGFRALARKR